MDDADLVWRELETRDLGGVFHGTDGAVGGNAMADHVFHEGR